MNLAIEKVDWYFDPQDAVRLLLGLRDGNFEFEYEISLYLLYIWALWPTAVQDGQSSPAAGVVGNADINMKNTARSLSTVITFTKMGKDRLPRAAQYKSVTDLVTRARTPWFMKFDRKFVGPLGGLRAQFIGAKSAKARHKAIRRQWENSLLVRDIVGYLCKVRQEKSQFLSGKALVVAIQEDIFNRGDYRERKRKGVISKEKIEFEWEQGSATAVLLYALQRKLPSITELNIAKPSFLRTLCQIASDHAAVSEVLYYYKQLTVLLHPAMRELPTLRRWSVIEIPGPIPDTIVNEAERLEVFSEKESLRLRKTSTAVPNRQNGNPN